MKKIFYLLLLLPVLSLTACSDDFSDCEKIGHVMGAYTTQDCSNISIECEAGSDNYEECIKLQSIDKSTEQGCRELIDYLNGIDETTEYLLRCPLTKSRIANKTADFYMTTASGKYVYNDGTVINMSDLLTDTENIYIISTYETGKFLYLDSMESEGFIFKKYDK